ncbi:MAG: hypothetical protein N3A01_02475 [Bacteroidales bacterium]|nr:hypothetical protein [Bacteroidales bacterium]
MNIFLFWQIINLILLKTIEQSANLTAIDVMNNIYLVDKRNLYMFDIEGNKKYEYINRYLDDITNIDVSDPFKILLFYKNFNKIIFLSNKLTELDNGVDLEDLNLYYIEAACRSSKNGFWVFDRIFKNPIFITNSLEIKIKGSSIFIDSINTDTFNITMREINECLYICIPKKGIFIYDLQGNLADYKYFNGIEYFQVLNDSYLLLQINGSLYTYNLKTEELQKIIADNNRIVCFEFFKNKLMVSNGENVKIYEIK